MSLKQSVIAAAAVLAALVRPAPGQVQYGGYLAAAAFNGQAESANPRWTTGDILAGFQAAGVVGQKFAFAAEARTLGVSSFELNQAWVGFVPSPAIAVRAGLFLVPFGNWNRASRPHETPLIATPLNLEHLYPASWREVGAMVEGEVGILSYAGYIGNGLGGPADGPDPVQRFRDNNANKGKGGRLGLKIGREARAGLSYYTGKYDDLGLYDLTFEGADLAWVTQQWEVHGEYTKALIDNAEPLGKGKSEGYSVWMLMGFRNFQPVGSFQKVSFEGPYYGQDPGARGLRDRTRWTLGLRFVLNANLFLKVEYDWNKEKEPRVKDNVFQVQAALRF